MPGGSSATPGDAPKTEPPMSLLGAAGPAGSAALDVSSEVKGETPVTTHSAISVAERSAPTRTVLRVGSGGNRTRPETTPGVCLE